METIQKKIIGNIVKYVTHIEDYFQIFFVDGSVLNLYNEVIFSHDYKLFSDEIVQDMVLDNTEMCISFNGKKLYMSMLEKDYLSTEAFAFCCSDKKWIIM